MLRLRNEANSPVCLDLSMSLTGRWLRGQLRQFVTWLRFAGIGFVWGVWVL
jgi:hypothetical protein